MVPKFDIMSSRVIPTPESKIMIEFSFSFVVTEIRSSSPVVSPAPVTDRYRCFSSASQELLTNSRIKTSLSLYKLFATISNSCCVSV